MECLDTLSGFKGTLFQFEVIIVDNDSADGIFDKIKSDYPGFIFIGNKVNGGFANGCNLGSTIAKGDFFLFLNPDTIASEKEVGKLLGRAKENAGNFIFSCRQVNENGKENRAFGLFPGFGTLTGTGRAIYKILKKKRVDAKTKGKVNVIIPDWVSGSVIMIKKEIFRNLGGFDEDFWMYYEDTDLCRRARDMKGGIAYYTDITIQHNHGGSSRLNLKIASITKTEVIISRHIYISKHFSGISGLLIQSYLVLNDIITGIFLAFFGILFFTSPKMFLRVHIFCRLVEYYMSALKCRSWISPRSVNFISSR